MTMSLKQLLKKDLDDSLKSNQGIALMTLRVLFASILNKEKEKRYKIFSLREIPRSGTKTNAGLSEKELEEKSALSDEEIIDVLASEAKKRKESILAYEQGKREDLANKEKAELEILQKYLPEPLSEEELKKIVKEAVEKTGAKEMKDPSLRSGQVMGKIMAEVMPKVKGRADGNAINKIVKELLQK